MGRLDVPKYFRVSGRFWFDERAAKWPDDLKLFALYLLTNQHRTMEGIFVLPVPYMAADLRWSPKKIDQMMTALRDEEFISYDLDTNTILIRNALKYQSPENPNQSEACLRRIKELPKSSIVREFQVVARKHCYRKGPQPQRKRSRNCWTNCYSNTSMNSCTQQGTLLIFNLHLHLNLKLNLYLHHL